MYKQELLNINNANKTLKTAQKIFCFLSQLIVKYRYYYFCIFFVQFNIALATTRVPGAKKTSIHKVIHRNCEQLHAENVSCVKKHIILNKSIFPLR